VSDIAGSGGDGAQVAVSSYRPEWWPSKTEILIRRVRLDVSQVSADSRSRRRRTPHPDQRVLPLKEQEEAGKIYAYSFICANIDVSSPDNAVAVEHWHRQRATIENIFRDGKHGAALRHLPSGYQEVNTATRAYHAARAMHSIRHVHARGVVRGQRSRMFSRGSSRSV
jgi:hypothetical protein